MSKTLAPSNSVTTRDPKGLKFISIVEAVYNKAGLSEEEARCVNDAPGLSDVVRGFIDANRMDRAWREQDGVIYFSVASDGTAGPQWIEWLEDKGFQIGGYAKSVLRSTDFQPTNGVTTEIVVLKGALFNDSDRITRKIRSKAYHGVFTAGRKLLDPNAEVACLIREKFSDEDIKDMGLWWIVAMHEPIKDFDGGPGLLSAGRGGDDRWLDAYCDGSGDRWSRDSGFAFAVAQIQ